MKNDFDRVINRSNTDSVKWGDAEKRFGHADILPMWVADMDFQAPAEVINKIIGRAEHGIYGYLNAQESFHDAVIDWVKKRNNWEIEKEWIVITPCVVTSIKNSVLSYTSPGDKVLIQTPVYPPFFSCIEENNRKSVLNPLKLCDGRYEIDFEDLEQKLKDDIKLMILCSPHNPIGRVWTKGELGKIDELCRKNNVLVLSDEIHSDIIYNGNKHTAFASLGKDTEENAIVFISASKTFNIAGLATSISIIPNEQLRKKFKETLSKNGADLMNIFGMVASEAAFRYGEEWLDKLVSYLQGNIDLLDSYLMERIPEIKLIKPEGTYLAWLDCSKLNVDMKHPEEFFIKQSKVWLNDGATFGTNGKGFQRMNIACPRTILLEGLARIEKSIRNGKG